MLCDDIALLDIIVSCNNYGCFFVVLDLSSELQSV